MRTIFSEGPENLLSAVSVLKSCFLMKNSVNQISHKTRIFTEKSLLNFFVSFLWFKNRTIKFLDLSFFNEDFSYSLELTSILSLKRFLYHFEKTQNTSHSYFISKRFWNKDSFSFLNISLQNV